MQFRDGMQGGLDHEVAGFGGKDAVVRFVAACLHRVPGHDIALGIAIDQGDGDCLSCGLPLERQTELNKQAFRLGLSFNLPVYGHYTDSARP